MLNRSCLIFRYAATVRVQKHRQEIIEDLAAMVKEHLVMFYKSTGIILSFYLSSKLSFITHFLYFFLSLSLSLFSFTNLHILKITMIVDNKDKIPQRRIMVIVKMKILSRVFSVHRSGASSINNYSIYY